MNRLFTILIFIILVIPFTLKAQINYQASVVSFKAGKYEAVPDQVLNSIVVTLYKDSVFSNNNSVYQEIHSKVPVKNCVVNLIIGKGTLALFSPTFESLKWSIDKPYYVKIDFPDLNISGQLKQLGTVPYALSVASSDWKSSGDTVIYTTKKYVGIGTDKPTSRLQIEGNLLQSAANDFVSHKFSNQNRTKYFELSPGGDFYLFDKNNQQYNLIAKANGNVGIGTSDPKAKLDVNGSLNVVGDLNCGTWENHQITLQEGRKLIQIPKDPDGRLIFGIHQYQLNSSFDFVDLFDNDLLFRIKENGVVWCKKDFSAEVIEVRGADIVEKAENTEGVQAGEVIVIDPATPNKVKRSQKAYDKTVVGVVSGAGGIKHGMQLAQEGVLDGNTNFAIAGRVYVKVTGKVEPGDLLTTSDKAGYAMKAKNLKKAMGAVIGKALSAPNTEGLVLMLVMMR